MRVLPGGVRRLAVLVGAAALTFPAVASAAGEPGVTAKFGTSVRAVAAESAGSVIAVGNAGGAMLLQRVSSAGAVGATFNAGNGLARGVAVQADGKIVVVGADSGAVVRRFNTDGSPDLGFGAGGTTTIADVTANAVAVSAAGQIVVGGSIPGGDGFSRVALVRLAANGAPDPGFGANGVATLDLGRNSQAKSVAIQADGKVVFAGQQIPELQAVSALVGRANANGTLDGGFGTNGAFVRFPQGGGANATFEGVTIDASGRVIVAGAELQSGGSFAIFVRLSANGQPDGGFGSGGTLVAEASVNYGGGDPVGARSVAIAGGGTIVAGGVYADSGVKSSALWALTPAGQLNTAVGTNGRVLAQQGAVLADIRGIAVTGDGSIFAGGDASDDLFLPNTGFVTKYNGFGAIAPPPPPPPPVVAKLTAASLSPRTLRPKTKAKLRFTLSLASRVTLSVEKQLKGRRKGKQSCKKPSSANRGGRSCTYYSKVKGSKKVSGKTGANSLTFTRKFPSKNLSAGNYRLTLKLSNGSVKRLTFTVRSR